MYKPDRRVGKTKKAIYEAFTALLHEKKYTRITVQEIIDRADVGRTTFYAHFPTKDDLLSGYVEQIFESFNIKLAEHIRPENDGAFFPVAKLFAHIKDNERMIQGILLSESGELLLEKLSKSWSERLALHLSGRDANGRAPRVPFDLLVNHIINTLIAMARYWLQSRTAYTPEQMEAYFYSLITPAVRFAMDR